MSNEEMIELMAMDDNGNFGMVMLDQFEWRKVDRDDALGTEASAWYGNDYNKAWFKAEGEIIAGEYQGRTELLWDRAVSRWFNFQAGVRHDLDEASSRSWLALEIQGLAPYWFEIEAAAYIGDAGRTALRFSGEYEVLLTQRLILQPELDVDFYGKDDPGNGIGAGLSEAELALRLRYEVRREFAPYIGIVWSQRFGDTADFARVEGLSKSHVEFTAGVRVWF
jgi:copper resistance protein B